MSVWFESLNKYYHYVLYKMSMIFSGNWFSKGKTKHETGYCVIGTEGKVDYVSWEELWELYPEEMEFNHEELKTIEDL
jgi:hypothetical protein